MFLIKKKEKPPIPPKRTVISAPIMSNSEEISKPHLPDFHSHNGSQSEFSQGKCSSHILGSPKDFNIQGLTLPALAPVQVKIRRLNLAKSVNGDFGFTIRRVQFPVGHSGQLRTVVFAEPTEIHSGPPRPEEIKSGLLPGDELIEVEGRSVESMSREELNETVRKAGTTIELVVKAVPELAEFCDKRRGVRDIGDALLLSNVDTNLHEDMLEDEKYWLIHKGGYTVARLLEMLPDGRARIQVAGREMIVDSTDIDRTNPTRFDRSSEISHLPYINETSTIHLLRQRCGSNLQYTNAGSHSLVSVSGIEVADGASERLVHLFKGCRRGQMPSHVYATAQLVYRNLQMTGLSQSIVLTGISGSGKSMQIRNLVHYLSSVAGWTKSLTYEKLTLVLGVLEAFGNAATHLHSDSTRFINLFSLGFDKAAGLKSARVQVGLLECDRVHRRLEGDSTFHVFYYLWEGVDEAMRSRLHLNEIKNPPFSPYHKPAEREKAREAWNHLVVALRELGSDEESINGIWNILAAILHLYAAGSTPGSAQRSQFVRAGHAEIAAKLLGVTVEELAQAVFRGKTANAPTSAMSRLSFTSRGPDGPESLISFAGGLYQEVFNTIVERINGVLSSPTSCTFISILDYPGASFHTEWTQKSRRYLGLNDLVHNYVNERVTELFYDVNFVEPQEVYIREQVDVNVDKPLSAPHNLTRLLDQKQQLLSCTDIELRSEERRGLLAIIEEESMFPGGTDESLLERIFVHLGDDNKLIRRGLRGKELVLSHAMGAYPVTYNVDGWLKQAQPIESAAAVRPLMANSKIAALSTLAGASALPASASKLRRATQVAQIELAAKRAPSSFHAYINSQIDYIFSSLRRAARSHFVHCIQSTTDMRTTSHQMLETPFVRSQLRSILLIDAVRANNRGFPERVAFRDFRRRFGCLADDDNALTPDEALDDRAAVARILDKMDIHQHRYRLGMSQLLLAIDVLSELEDRREFSLSGLVAAFQNECRRHLANKWLVKRRIHETAIKCIQRNGVAFMRVREWSWWRLYTRVVPLLAANKTDDDSRRYEDRIRHLEQQLQEMKKNSVRAEGRVEELEETIDRQTQETQEISGKLEHETQNRIQMERRMQKLKEGGFLDDNISRVSSSAALESSAEGSKQVSDLKEEINRIKESEQQLKTTTQRAVSHLQDVESELNRVRSRNEILEKKQQRFDSDIKEFEDQLKTAVQEKENVVKEKEEVTLSVARKTNEIQTLKAETVDLRSNVNRLRREAEEREGPGGANGELLVTMQKTRTELEQKLKQQEEELDDLAGQNQQMRQNVTRLEMAGERLKTDILREQTAKDEEIDEIRTQYQRRLRGMEDQLADANDKCHSLTAQNRMLEARGQRTELNSSLDLSGGHYRRELRKALALLADTKALLAHERDSTPSQTLIRQLRQQVEDAESCKTSALKGKHNLESELNEIRAMLEQALMAKTQAEERSLNLLREKNSSGALIEEKDEQLLSLLKKYKAALQQNHIDHITIADYIEQIADLEKAKCKLSDEVNDLKSEREFSRLHTVEKHKLQLAEQKIRDAENRVELESAHKQRLEAMVVKLTDEIDMITEQLTEATAARDREMGQARKARKDIVNLQEMVGEAKKREVDTAAKSKSERSETSTLEEQVKALQAKLKLANRRIESLQSALSDDLADCDGYSDEEEHEGLTMDEREGMGISVL